MNTHIFRVMRLLTRRRYVVGSGNNTPTNVPPGEMLYDETANKLYVGTSNNSVAVISDPSGAVDVTNVTIDGGTY